MPADDPRHLSRGYEIPNEDYCDQPYILKTDDGAWLCTITTGAGREGRPGQHLIAMRSKDQGKTWTAPVDVEPSDGPEASYGVLQKAAHSAPRSVPDLRIQSTTTFPADPGGGGPTGHRSAVATP